VIGGGNWNGDCAKRLAPNPKDSATAEKMARSTAGKIILAWNLWILLRDVVETEHQLIGLVALTISSEHQHAIADTARDDWRGEPAAVSNRFMIPGQFQRVSVL